MQQEGFASRPTVTGLCDPWVDLLLDHQILPHIHLRPDGMASLPATPQSYRGPISPQSYRGPITPQTDRGPITPQTDRGPITPQTDRSTAIPNTPIQRNEGSTMLPKFPIVKHPLNPYLLQLRDLCYSNVPSLR